MSNNNRVQDDGPSVCDSQADFNTAFRKAVKNMEKEDMKKNKTWIYIYMVLWFMFFIWAVLLAMKVESGPMKVMHLTFAMLFSPVYVVSYYLGLQQTA
jgi:hypothetical protein